jgi:hypothetical protein
VNIVQPVYEQQRGSGQRGSFILLCGLDGLDYGDEELKGVEKDESWSLHGRSEKGIGRNNMNGEIDDKRNG